MGRLNLAVRCDIDIETDMDNPELKNQGRIFLTKQEDDIVSQLTKMTSDWRQMRRIKALVILFIK